MLHDLLDCPESVGCPIGAAGVVTNRLRPVLLHVPYYTIEGVARLALDADLACSTVSRVLRGKVNPSYQVIRQLTRALSRRWGKPIDPREVFTTDGTYPTDSVCALMDCEGCLPPEAWNEVTNTLKPSWRGKKPGDWCRTTTQKPEEGPACKQDSHTPAVYL